MAFVDSRRDDDDEISCPGRGGGGVGRGTLFGVCYWVTETLMLF